MYRGILLYTRNELLSQRKVIGGEGKQTGSYHANELVI